MKSENDKQDSDIPTSAVAVLGYCFPQQEALQSKQGSRMEVRGISASVFKAHALVPDIMCILKWQFSVSAGLRSHCITPYCSKLAHVHWKEVPPFLLRLDNYL